MTLIEAKARYQLSDDQEIVDAGPGALIVKCSCGSLRRLSPSNALRARSCGCKAASLSRQANTRHGHTSWRGRPSRTWNIWSKIKERIRPTYKRRQDYFDRGIGLCDRWLSFDNFLADMGPVPAGMQIDRIDNDRGYEPGNCRWTTAKENSRNRRDNCLVTYNGETKTCAEWSELTGINYQTLQSRIHSRKPDLWPDLFAPPKRKSA